MVTGPRGRSFISYRWSGDPFRSVVETLALGLVRRGYEVVFDAWYIDQSVNEPALHMMRELAASTNFVAAISPDYLSVLAGTVSHNEFGKPASHDVGNDGWVRDELNHVIMQQHEYHGLGLCFGCTLSTNPCFPFNTFVVRNNAELAEVLDTHFGAELELPTYVRPEIKHSGKWIALPTLPLHQAYRVVRRALAILAKRPCDYFLPPSDLALWSRLDRLHLIWESRATPLSDAEASENVLLVTACRNCTAQFQMVDQPTRCPRCRRATLERRIAGKVEALVVMRPAD